jgi:type II secretory pathway component PulJ
MIRAIRRRQGMSLLELILASAMLTTVVGAAAVVLRGMHVAWQAHDEDAKRIQAAHATLRHIVRRCRQAQAVSAITAAGDTAGALSLAMPDGSIAVWSRNAATGEVLYGLGSTTDVLAEQITELTFTGYRSDGVTTTSTPAEIHAVKCQVRVDLPRDTGGLRRVSCWAWLRSW